MSFFLGEYHIEVAIIEVVSNAVRIPIDSSRVYFSLREDLFLVTFIYRLSLDFYFDDLLELFLSGWEASDYHIFPLIVFVTQ